MASVDECTAAFGEGNVMIYSNSAGGWKDARKDYYGARLLEDTLGLPVIRHGDGSPFERKPWGSILPIREHLLSQGSSETDDNDAKREDPLRWIMVGDRIFTDTGFGNRYGMLTIVTDPVSESAPEPWVITAGRRWERRLILPNRAQYVEDHTPMTLNSAAKEKDPVVCIRKHFNYCPETELDHEPTPSFDQRVVDTVLLDE